MYNLIGNKNRSIEIVGSLRGVGNGEFVLSGHRVSVWEDEKLWKCIVLIVT